MIVFFVVIGRLLELKLTQVAKVWFSQPRRPSVSDCEIHQPNQTCLLFITELNPCYYNDRNAFVLLQFARMHDVLQYAFTRS